MSLATKMIADIERAQKAALKAYKIGEDEEDIPESTRAKLGEKAFTHFLQKKANTINLLCDLMEDPNNEYANAMQRFASIVKQKQLELNNKQAYFISIRPDDTKVDIVDFTQRINKVVSRKCFLEGKYSFEQKGTCVDDLGKGFHVHIVAQMTQNSKGQVLRDLTSSFKDWIELGYITPNNIDVRTTKNPDELINSYLVEYKSDDGHKVTTQAMDELWRTGNSLKRLYTLTQ